MYFFMLSDDDTIKVFLKTRFLRLKYMRFYNKYVNNIIYETYLILFLLYKSCINKYTEHCSAS